MIGDRRWCERCRRTRTVVDAFTEADHGLADARQWAVVVLSCDHYRTGPERSAVAQL
jgi:hypothetical protein